MKIRYIVKNVTGGGSYLFPDGVFRYDTVEARHFETRGDACQAITAILAVTTQRTEHQRAWNNGTVLTILEVFLPDR